MNENNGMGQKESILVSEFWLGDPAEVVFVTGELWMRITRSTDGLIGIYYGKSRELLTWVRPGGWGIEDEVRLSIKILFLDSLYTSPSRLYTGVSNQTS